jgi:hypothetical protein
MCVNFFNDYLFSLNIKMPKSKTKSVFKCGKCKGRCMCGVKLPVKGVAYKGGNPMPSGSHGVSKFKRVKSPRRKSSKKSPRRKSPMRRNM